LSILEGENVEKVFQSREKDMKTTIDIPGEELQQLLENTGAKTKREAVVTAVRDFNKRHRLAKLAEMLGTFEDFMDAGELKQMRENRHGTDHVD